MEVSVFGSILHRAILGELIRVFALSLLGITGILVMAGIVAEASQQGLNPAQILMIIPLLIPSTLPYTIPATTLFATCVVYGRLAHDNEILAIRAAGVHLLKVVWPAVLLGLVMSCTTMGLYYRLIPYTQYLLRAQFLNDVEEYLYAMLKKDRCIKQPGLNYYMWVRGVQGTRLQDALFKRKDAKGNYDVIARARSADLRVDLAHKEVLVHMQHCYLYSEDGKSSGYFQDKVWPVDLPKDFGTARAPRARAMSCPQLLAHTQELRAEVETRATEIAMTIAQQGISNPPADLPTHLNNLRNIQNVRRLEILGFMTEFHLRPALSFGCLFFVLVGCPVGIWFSRSDYLSAFITCFLPIVFIYYPLVLCMTNLSKQGKFETVVAVWVANTVMGFIALLLFRRLLKN
jgi:lipopolysaccharide export system permease protein